MPKKLQRGIAYSSMAQTTSHDPFINMEIQSDEFLDEVTGRESCTLCSKSRKLYCYSCYIAMDSIEHIIPRLELPIQVDVIKHPSETDGKSSAVHAALVSPCCVKIMTYPDIPEYPKDGSVALVFPHATASTIKDMVTSQCLVGRPRLSKVVFVDSTWNQTGTILSHPNVQGLPYVTFEPRASLFWRYQRGKPLTHLSTIEAIYYFFVDYSTAKDGVYSFYHQVMRLPLTIGFIVTLCGLLVQSRHTVKNDINTYFLQKRVQNAGVNEEYRRSSQVMQRRRRDSDYSGFSSNMIPGALPGERVPGKDGPQRAMLSILNPLDVLRQRLLIEMNRRRNEMQARENKKLLDNVGRRRKRHISQEQRRLSGKFWDQK